MTDDIRQPTEEERQTIATARLRDLMEHFSVPPDSAEPLDTLWPDIRNRIERAKVIPLDAAAASSPRPRTKRRAIILSTVAAAAIIVAVLFDRARRTDTAAPDSGAASSTLIAVSDSVRTYEEEAQALLNRLEVQRAMLRPEAVASIDRDLAVVDSAIAELRTAIAQDPRDPALRRLLAQSYKQKIELLKRAGNAG